MIPLGILASSSIRWDSAELLAPTNLVATLVEPAPLLPTVIGEAYGGGFYAGDIEYPDGQWYKLIVADISADIKGSDSRWKVRTSSTSGTDHLIDGVSNTAAMIADSVEHPAADHCTNHSGGGFEDWYMPAKDELNVIYLNLGFNRPNCPPHFLRDESQAFYNAYYWASTQYNVSNGWRQSLNTGAQSGNTKSSTSPRVRPVRRLPFTPD